MIAALPSIEVEFHKFAVFVEPHPSMQQKSRFRNAVFLRGHLEAAPQPAACRGPCRSARLRGGLAAPRSEAVPPIWPLRRSSTQVCSQGTGASVRVEGEASALALSLSRGARRVRPPRWWSPLPRARRWKSPLLLQDTKQFRLAFWCHCLLQRKAEHSVWSLLAEIRRP